MPERMRSMGEPKAPALQTIFMAVDAEGLSFADDFHADGAISFQQNPVHLGVTPDGEV